jgi:uncharacterized coiled-coil DUF342 family protein
MANKLIFKIRNYQEKIDELLSINAELHFEVSDYNNDSLFLKLNDSLDEIKNELIKYLETIN